MLFMEVQMDPIVKERQPTGHHVDQRSFNIRSRSLQSRYSIEQAMLR